MAKLTTKLIAEASLPTKFGKFKVYAFADEAGSGHLAVVKGELKGKLAVPVRVHSECLTGDVFGSLRCDCRGQLEKALEHIGKSECGALVYLRQEGRGIGLLNKIRAYTLQENGYDTVDANIALGFKEDMRGYRTAAEILKILGVKSVVLLTNNPHKLEELALYGIEIAGRMPITTKPTAYNKRYLSTKKKRMGHMLEEEKRGKQ
ncbi:MAG: GTP cyclohydrolase II [Candidatus Micrarchaeota archaeon]